MTICIISVLNFSLAAVMAVLIGIPLSLGTPRPKLLSTLSGLFVFPLLMPVGLLGLMASVRGAESVARAVGRNILEWELFGVWFAPFVCIVYFPLILQAWLVYLLPS